MSRPTAERTAYIAALPGEARALARLPAMGACRRADGSHVILGGMGPNRAEVAARRAIADGARGLVSWGVAAALEPTLAPGDLVLPERVVATDGQVFEIDVDWRTTLATRLSPRIALRAGVLAETRSVLADAPAKARLHAATQALACDMESAAIAAVAREHGAAFLAVRVILDDAAMGLPPAARAAMDDAGHLQPVALTRAMIGRPLSLHAQLRGLKQLAVAFRAARMTLADVAPAVLNEAAA